jgi:hypothetical protein
LRVDALFLAPMMAAKVPQTQVCLRGGVGIEDSDDVAYSYRPIASAGTVNDLAGRRPA